MGLRLVRSASSRVLWEACVERFLDGAAGSPGPSGHMAHLWLTHRNLRDRLLDTAYERGVKGWLAPPISFFSELPDRFGLASRPIGLLTRRRLVARLAARHASRLDIALSADRGIIRGHMMDGLLGELLPEGVEPDALAESLAALEPDDFGRRRNEWVVGVYRDYLAELGASGRYDDRAVHAMIAEAMMGGRERGRGGFEREGERERERTVGLRGAIGDARELHVYGLYTLRSRRRLIEALAAQTEVAVSLYTLREEEPGEWDELALELGLEVEELAGGEGPAAASGSARHSFDSDPAGAATSRSSSPSRDVLVQPAPDALREYGWVAGRVKRLLVEDDLEPHEIAVVARTGREDTRLACAALEAAGVPCTARMRVPLCDIGALKALLELFRGAATEWAYRPLRNVLASPYFDGDVDLRGIDFVAGIRRLSGLAAWADELARLAAAPGDDGDAGDAGDNSDVEGAGGAELRGEA